MRDGGTRPLQMEGECRRWIDVRGCIQAHLPRVTTARPVADCLELRRGSCRVRQGLILLVDVAEHDDAGDDQHQYRQHQRELHERLPARVRRQTASSTLRYLPREGNAPSHATHVQKTIPEPPLEFIQFRLPGFPRERISSGFQRAVRCGQFARTPPPATRRAPPRGLPARRAARARGVASGRAPATGRRRARRRRGGRHTSLRRRRAARTTLRRPRDGAPRSASSSRITQLRWSPRRPAPAPPSEHRPASRAQSTGRRLSGSTSAR